MGIELSDKGHPMAPKFCLVATCDDCGESLWSTYPLRPYLYKAGWKITGIRSICPKCRQKPKDKG